MERQADPGTNPAMEPDVDAVAGAHLDTERVDAPEAVTLRLPAQPRYMRVARLVAAGLANELGFGVDRLDDVRLAVGEACALAVQAGAQGVDLSYSLDDATLSVSLDAVLAGADSELGADYLTLVDQVFAVACSAHHVERDDRRMSMRLSFVNGR